MNRKITSLSKHNENNSQQFYTILEQETRSTTLANQTDQLSKLLRQGKQLLYIDINEQKGFKLMQPCPQSKTHEDSLHLGHNYITNLQNLSESSAKVVSLLLQLKQDGCKKERSARLMDQEIKRKRDKLRQVGRSIVKRQQLNAQPSKPIIYRGMSSELVQKLMLTHQYEQTQNQLRKRQSDLLQHYGIPAAQTLMLENHPKNKQKDGKQLWLSPTNRN